MACKHSIFGYICHHCRMEKTGEFLLSIKKVGSLLEAKPRFEGYPEKKMGYLVRI